LNYSSVARVLLSASSIFRFFGGASEPSFTHLEQVYKRLKLTLELVKKEMEISKLQVTNLLPVFSIMFCPIFLVFNMLLFQQSIAKAIEEKISGDQRRYLLNEQLKAIKKVLSLLCTGPIRLPVFLLLQKIRMPIILDCVYHVYRSWDWRLMTKQHCLVCF
jgi:hypothetical protein